MARIDQNPAVGLEAYFLRQTISELMRAGGTSFGGSSFAGATFGDMLAEALADSIAEQGGVGIARALESQLSPASPASPTLELPVEGAISSGFGRRRDPFDGSLREHQGLDLAAPRGTPVTAAGPGVVVRAEEEPGYGKLIVLDHGGGLETRYAHLDALDVQAGARVAAGAKLGEVGSTGHSTGPHLHFEVRRAGRSVDPRTELKRRPGPPAR